MILLPIWSISSLIPTSSAYNQNIHSKISKSAYFLLKNNGHYQGLINELETKYNGKELYKHMMQGSWDADGTESINHGWSPDWHIGSPWWWFPIWGLGQLAVKYYGNAINYIRDYRTTKNEYHRYLAYYYLGFTLHMIQDACQPQHTAFIDGTNPIHIDFELYCGANSPTYPIEFENYPLLYNFPEKPGHYKNPINHVKDLYRGSDYVDYCAHQSVGIVSWVDGYNDKPHGWEWAWWNMCRLAVRACAGLLYYFYYVDQ